ncbi:MAG: LacI family transcriptional regulator [Bacteroidetes bacterium]|nr:LacI family transcriptional regulator [Bacteroidota bacterium]MBU1678046.1 LacI family transcriptional regulator [Bacteroidota bacterium]MBU2507642.1 LacI family transcriptional regulator [Bacteroidota bacterium]
MKATIYDIANKAGVSTATVSRALGDKQETVRPETRDRILQISNQLNYRPNSLAKNLAKSTTSAIGLVLPEIQGDFYTEIVKGVDEIAFSGGYHLIVASSHSRRNIVESLLGFMRESLVDGVILMIPSMNGHLEEVLANYKIPVVIINDIHAFDKYDIVSIDNFQGAYSIINYTIKSLNHSKISMITGPSGNYDSQMRKKGYTAALKDAGITIRKDWIIEGDFTIKGGELACSRILSLKEKPDVIFAANDNMAAGCYNASESLGFKIPEDICIIGFDHIELGNFLRPKLTTVHVPVSEIGKTSTKLLIKRLRNKDDKSIEPQHIKISTGIIIGDSVSKLNN